MSRDLKRQLNTKIHEEVDNRIEGVCNKFGLEKSEIVRRIINDGLPRFEKARRLPPLVVAEDGEAEE